MLSVDDADSVVPQDGPAAQGFDFNALFAGAPTDENERKVSGQTVPSFGYYVVHFGGAKGGFKKTGTPGVRPWAQIKEGLDGTVGVLVSDDLGNPFLAPALTTEEDGVKKAKPAELLKKQADAIQRILNKVARVAGFALARPRDLGTQQGLDVYAEQFAANGGFDAVIEIKEEMNEYQGNKSLRNRFNWDSIAKFNDPAGTKQYAGKTALEEAKAKIAERNKSNAAKSGTSKSGTAGATSRTDPTQQSFAS